MPTPSVYYQTHHDLERAREALEAIDAELDVQVYLGSGRDNHAFAKREADQDLPADYEHHVIIREELWDKIRKALAPSKYKGEAA